jgi:membrane protease YdiL (CAAX protease family)
VVGVGRRWYAWCLTGCYLAGSLLVLPYGRAMFQTAPQGPPNLAVFAVVLVIQTLFVYLFVRLGLAGGARVDLGWPPLDGWLERDTRRASRAVMLATITGVVAALLIPVLARLMPMSSGSLNIIPPSPAVVLMASIGAGLNEEVLSRVAAMGIAAWVIYQVVRDRVSKSVVVWSANLTAALMFGVMHLPAAASIGPLTLPLAASVVILNAVVGMLFGWLYWRKGIIAAMICHAVLDIVMKVVLPALDIS